MKLYTLLLGLLLLLLSGCHDTKAPAPVSSAGTLGPVLEQPLPKNARILVLSTLQPISIHIISENIFFYKTLGRLQIPASHLNPSLSQTMTHVLQNKGYRVTASAALNTDNPLNTANIQYTSSQLSGSVGRAATHIPPPGALTPEAKPFLFAQIKQHPADFIVLLTQTGPQPLVFNLKCELSKMNTYSRASIEPDLYLYKIYFIDAHSMRPLAWITGGFSSDLRNTRWCAPPEQLKADQREDLNKMMIQGLNKVVREDLSQALHYRAPS